MNVKQVNNQIENLRGRLLIFFGAIAVMATPLCLILSFRADTSFEGKAPLLVNDSLKSKRDREQNLGASQNSLSEIQTGQENEASTILPPSLAENTESLYGFAFVPNLEKFIWTNSDKSTFEMADADGSNVIEIKSNFEEPFHIKVDHFFGYYLFFYADGAIWRKDIDTQTSTTTDTKLLDLGSFEPHGMGLNDATDLLFIGDHYGQINRLIRLNRDGDVIDQQSIPSLVRPPLEES